MTTLLASLISELWPILATVLGAVIWGIHQRHAGAKAERDKHAAERLKAREIADQVDNDIGALPPDKAREALKQWPL